jgi:hypothetical protein
MPTKIGGTDPSLIPIFAEFAPIRIKYKDIFDMKEFYTALHEWLLEYEWYAQDKRSNDGMNVDHWETYYGEKVGQGGAREIWIHWRLRKDPKGAPFLTYYMDFEFHCIALTGAEVVRGGNKYKVNKGEVDMKYWTYIEKGYAKAFQKNRILKHIEPLFTKRIYRKDLEKRKKELYQESYVLQNFIKQWFKLKRYAPYEEVKSFFPSMAWPSHQKEK